MAVGLTIAGCRGSDRATSPGTQAETVPLPSDPSLLPQDLRPSVEAAAEACRRAPRDPAPVLELARLYHANGQIALAARCYARAIDLGADDARTHYLLGLLLLEQGRVEQAANNFLSARNEARDYPPLHHHLAGALRDLGRLEEAIGAFQDAISLAPREASYHVGLGAALRQTGRLEPAEASLRAALAIDPGDDEAHHLLGLVLLVGDREGEAREHLDRVAIHRDTIAADPWLAEVQERTVVLEILLDRAEAYLDNGEPGRARQLAASLAATHPSAAAVQLVLGRSLLALGQNQLAVDALQRAAHLDPGGAAPHVELAAILHRNGMRDEAEHEADLALATDPGNVSALITKAAIQVERGRTIEAREIIQGVLARRDDLPQAHIVLGEALSLGGDLEGASAAYARAASLAADSEFPHRRLAEIYRQLGRKDAAKRELDEARRLGSREDGP